MSTQTAYNQNKSIQVFKNKVVNVNCIIRFKGYFSKLSNFSWEIKNWYQLVVFFMRTGGGRCFVEFLIDPKLFSKVS